METAENLISNLGLEFGLDQLTSNEKFESVKSAVNELIVHDFNLLVQLLYRVDVPEAKLKKALQDQTGTDAAEIITRMLIDRQVQKIKFRQASNRGNNTIPDEERW